MRVVVTGGAGFVGLARRRPPRAGRPRRRGRSTHCPPPRTQRHPIISASAPSTTGSTSPTSSAFGRSSTAPTPCAIKPHASGSVGTSATSTPTSPTTTSAPPACSARCTRRTSTGDSCSPAAWWSTAKDATAAAPTGSSGPRREPPTRSWAAASNHRARSAAWDLVPEPVPEAAPMDPRSVYAATKLHQEHLCFALRTEP